MAEASVYDLAVGQKVAISTKGGLKYSGVVTQIVPYENTFTIKIDRSTLFNKSSYLFTFHNSVIEECVIIEK